MTESKATAQAVLEAWAGTLENEGEVARANEMLDAKALPWRFIMVRGSATAVRIPKGGDDA